MRRVNLFRILQAANPNQWYLYRTMGELYLQNQNHRYRQEPKNGSWWEHEERMRDGRWLTDEQIAKEARDEARRLGWLK